MVECERLTRASAGFPRSVALLLATAFVLGPSPARAVLVTHVLTGPFGEDGYRATLTYETDTPLGGVHPAPYDPAIGFDLFLEGTLFESWDPTAFVVKVTDTETEDRLAVSTSAGPFSNTSWGLLLIDSTGTVFSDGGLPLSLSLDDFDVAGMSLSWSPGGVRQDLVLGVDSLRTIPEPGTAVLLATGLLLMGRRAARARALGSGRGRGGEESAA